MVTRLSCRVYSLSAGLGSVYDDSTKGMRGLVETAELVNYKFEQ